MALTESLVEYRNPEYTPSVNPYKNVNTSSHSLSSLNRYTITKFEFQEMGESLDNNAISVQNKSKRIRLGKFGQLDPKESKRCSVMVNNKVAEGEIRQFLNRKIKSKRERYRSDHGSVEVLPKVSEVKEDNLYANINLPSHYCNFHVSLEAYLGRIQLRSRDNIMGHLRQHYVELMLRFLNHIK